MISAQTMNVERVGVWLFNENRTQLNCIDLYIKSQHLHIEAEPLFTQELPKYFDAIQNNRLLVVNDIFQHKDTVELVLHYAPMYKIGATLEAAIWLNNQFIGVICHEHVSGVREWTLDEQNFVGSIAALASLTIETYKRRLAELALAKQNEKLEQMVAERMHSLHESELRFSYVVQHAPISILIIDRKGNIVDANSEAPVASGYNQKELLGKNFIRLLVAKESRSKATLMAARILKGESFRNVELMLQRADGEKFEHECSIGMTAKNSHASSGLMVAIAQNRSQQKALEKSLIKAREAAESSDRIKSLFVASMSHELRTPLNSIIGFLGIVLQGMSGQLNMKQKDQLGRAYHSSEHLLSLISDVIDISKIEAGFLQAHAEKFELKPLLLEVEHAVQHLAAEKKLVLTVDCANKLMLNTDRRRLYQAVLNVVSNALKYTEEGTVSVKASLKNKQVVITTKDTGIGIDEANLAVIFKPFERIDSRLKIQTLGTGLGLYLTRKILSELLGGTVEATSKPEDGSIFTITIPIKMPEIIEQNNIAI